MGRLRSAQVSIPASRSGCEQRSGISVRERSSRRARLKTRPATPPLASQAATTPAATTQSVAGNRDLWAMAIKTWGDTYSSRSVVR